MQPLMSFLFGRLTQDFVNFATAAAAADPQDQSVLDAQVVAAFKHSAALNASYLVYIGMLCKNHGSMYAHLFVRRDRHVRMHVHLHDHMGLHRRS